MVQPTASACRGCHAKSSPPATAGQRVPVSRESVQTAATAASVWLSTETYLKPAGSSVSMPLVGLVSPENRATVCQTVRASGM